MFGRDVDAVSTSPEHDDEVNDVVTSKHDDHGSIPEEATSGKMATRSPRTLTAIDLPANKRARLSNS